MDIRIYAYIGIYTYKCYHNHIVKVYICFGSPAESADVGTLYIHHTRARERAVKRSPIRRTLMKREGERDFHRKQNVVKTNTLLYYSRPQFFTLFHQVRDLIIILLLF